MAKALSAVLFLNNGKTFTAPVTTASAPETEPLIIEMMAVDYLHEITPIIFSLLSAAPITIIHSNVNNVFLYENYTQFRLFLVPVEEEVYTYHDCY